MSDHKGAALIYPMLPDAETIIADKGYDGMHSETLSPDVASRLRSMSPDPRLSAGR
jgi:hypothetical protein